MPMKLPRLIQCRIAAHLAVDKVEMLMKGHASFDLIHDFVARAGNLCIREPRKPSQTGNGSAPLSLTGVFTPGKESQECVVVPAGSL